jgi:DNA ligase (NAD+)
MTTNKSSNSIKFEKKKKTIKMRPTIEFIVEEGSENKYKLKPKNTTIKKGHIKFKIYNKGSTIQPNKAITQSNKPIKSVEEKIEKLSSDNDIKTTMNNIEMTTTLKKRYNEQFIELMEQLSTIMLKQGEPFRARAYQKAQETIMSYPNDITSPSDLKGLPGIGATIMDKLEEFVTTGTLRVLEKEKTNPINILGEIYGIGPVKAKELVDKGIKTIDELREKQNEMLNDIQKVGLKYHDQIIQRIPRDEIVRFEKIFDTKFNEVKKSSSDKFEIVGSYRRGAQTSGDIDVIITGETGAIYKAFVDKMLQTGIILEILSRGTSKTLVIAKLPEENSVARRVDFLYTPLNEFPFAILYFTGSKIFNTVMRQHGLNMGYTFNEHGIYHLVNKKKSKQVDKKFHSEKDIFDFLQIEYKEPTDRKDGRSVVILKKDSLSVKEDIEFVVEDDDTKEQLDTKEKKETINKKQEVEKESIFEPYSPSEKEAEQFIEDFKHNGLPTLENLNEKQLSTIIIVANKKYYNEEPIMTDNQYDIIKEYIETKYPTNQVITEIGAKIEKNKVQLPYEMASMDKIKPDTNALSNWKQKFIGPNYVLSCKLDGVSGLYTTEGKEPKLYTRGDGKVGQDISHLIPHLRLPKTKNIVIRGEFIIPKKVFEQKYKTTFANPRNMVAGIVNHKTINNSVNDLHFVAYEVIKPELKPSEQMEYLGTINVERVQNKIIQKDVLTNEYLSDLLVDWRENNPYEIDGVIVTDDKLYPRKSGNPEHAFAFKMVLSDQIAEAKVVNVIWGASKDGYLKPRVQIEPVYLGGVKIEYATGNNALFIEKNNIGIGATIELIRSGDVIPKIIKVTVPAPEPKMPDVPYKWNDTHVDIMLENIEDDPDVKEKNITGFFKGIGVEGLSSGNVTRLINAGHDSVQDIIQMSEDDFLQVEGFKGKMANKLYTGIQSKIKEASIVKLMAASNMFGRGFSEKKLELIISEIPDILVSDVAMNKKISEVASIKGMAIKTAEAFVNKIEDFKEFLIDCGLEYKLYETKEKENSKDEVIDETHPLFGKTIVLTGTRDKDILKYLETVGAKQGSGVSKNTFMVIAKSEDDDTGKAEEARKLNIPIMSVDNFKKKYFQ